MTLIEPAEAGRGVAYGTTCDAHLLNVRSGRMSLFPDDPDNFVRWLAERSPDEAEPQGFARRLSYGAYVADRLGEAEAAALGRLQWVRDRAISFERPDGFVRLPLSGGETVEADAAVLAVGNLPPEPLTLPGAATLGEQLIEDPWAAGALDRIGPDDSVLMIGTGLTAIDVALALDVRGWRGRGLMLSRRGLLPRSHDATAPHVEPERHGGVDTLSGRLRAFRHRLDGRTWGEAIDALRPFVADLWRAATPDERSRFLRHLRPWWDVHRHRTAPQVGAVVDRLRAAGRLELAAGRLMKAEAEPEGARVWWRPRGDTALRDRRFNHVVVCTGPAFDLERTADPLLGALFRRGRVRADPLRLSLDTDERCRVIDAAGRPSPRLYAMGPLTRGAFWEIVAMPDIREQAQGLADDLGRRFGKEDGR